MSSVLDRVRKLLALATSPNAHEAAVAAARAQQLIDEFRLEGWLNAERAAVEDPDPIVDARQEPLDVARRTRTWKLILAATLCEANGCVAYVLRRKDDEAIVLVGRARDRVVVTELYSWLVQRIEWLSATHGAGRSRKWHEAFRVGVVDAVGERLAASSQATTAELPAAALVIVEPAVAAEREALDSFVNQHLRLGKGRGLHVDARAWRAGKAASAELSLGPADPKPRPEK